MVDFLIGELLPENRVLWITSEELNTEGEVLRDDKNSLGIERESSKAHKEQLKFEAILKHGLINKTNIDSNRLASVDENNDTHF